MRLRFVFMILSFLIFASSSWASFIISPTTTEIELSSKTKRDPIRSFYLENRTDKPSALEFQIKKRVVKDGKVVTEDVPNVDELFTVYPKQFVLKPHTKRTVRVVYKGPKDIKDEINYRFVVTKIIVKHDKEKLKNKNGAVLDISLAYNGSIYVRPETAKPDVKMTSFSLEKQKDVSFIKFILENNGNAHKQVNSYYLDVEYLNKKGEKKTVKLDLVDLQRAKSKQLKDAIKNVLPGFKSTFLFPIDISDLKELKDVKITLKK